MGCCRIFVELEFSIDRSWIKGRAFLLESIFLCLVNDPTDCFLCLELLMAPVEKTTELCCSFGRLQVFVKDRELSCLVREGRLVPLAGVTVPFDFFVKLFIDSD